MQSVRKYGFRLSGIMVGWLRGGGGVTPLDHEGGTTQVSIPGHYSTHYISYAINLRSVWNTVVYTVQGCQ
jgi:hypothetical protein